MNQNPIIFFDGYCNLCSWWVGFVLKNDKQKQFRFCTLQSTSAEKILRSPDIIGLKNSVVVYAEKKIYTKSTAALTILKKLGGLWSMFYIFIIIPRFLRDAVYDLMAKYRYQWFGKKNQCYVPSIDERFLFIE